MADLLDFGGKHVVITGAASGIGAATMALLVERGADVHAVDLAPIERDVTSHICDLGQEQSIDDLVGRLPEHLDVIMNCAGVPNGGRFTPDEVMKVNWLGLRHLTESLLPRLAAGGAIVHIASTAGRDWSARVDDHQQLMEAETFTDGEVWLGKHPELVGDGYSFSKEAVQYYTLWRSVQLLSRGLRMNSVCPGVTDTSIVADFRRGLGDDLIDHAQAVAGRMAKPSEMAPAMLFLADSASSSYLNGVNLNIDRGTGAARTTDQSDPTHIWGEQE